MIQKTTITDLAIMLKSERNDMNDLEREYVCNGMLKDFEAKTAVNGKPYVHMVFADESNEINIQYFYKQLIFDPKSLEKQTKYNLHGEIKKNSKGIMFFNLTEKPIKNICDVEDARENCSDVFLFPIFCEDISDIVNEFDFYPVFADEFDLKESETLNRTCDNKKDNSNLEFTGLLAKELILKLGKEGIDVIASLDTIENFFEFAIDGGEVETGNCDSGSEYVKQIVMNLEFQLMLSGSSANKFISDMHIHELAKELFGRDLLGASADSIIHQVVDNSVIVATNQRNSLSSDAVISVVDENVVTEDNNSQDMGYFGEYNDTDEEIETNDEIIDVHSQEELQHLEYSHDAPSLNANGFDSLYDALKKSGGRVPQKKIANGEKEEYVDDIETIKMIEEKLPSTEKILYACDFMHVGLLEEKQFKKKSNGFFDVKHKFRDLQYLMLVVTETMAICTDRYAYRGEIRFNKSDIEYIEGVYTKNILLSVKDSQIQVKLKDGKYFVINKYFVDNKRYDEFLNGFIDVMNK